MLKKPLERYWTREAIDFVADQFDLQNEPWMQDWAYQVAEANKLDQYLAFFEEMRGYDEVRFVMADIIIQAFEDIGRNLHQDTRWTKFLRELLKNVELHAHQIWYWSSFETSLEEAWDVSPDIRLLAERA
jgi:hypothetical protein